MKKIISRALVLMSLIAMTAVSSYADEMTIPRAENIVRNLLAPGKSMPTSWGESYLGSKVVRLDNVSVSRVVPQKPDSAQCEKVWIVVTSVKGVGRTINGPIIGDHDFVFDKKGVLLMCIGYDGELQVSLQK